MAELVQTERGKPNQTGPKLKQTNKKPPQNTTQTKTQKKQKKIPPHKPTV